MMALFKKHKNLLPIILLGGLCLWTIYQVLFVKVEYEGALYGQSFTIKFWMGFTCVLIVITTYFFFRKHFKYIVFFMLALGLLSIIEFSTTSVKFGVNSLEFNGTAFLACLLYTLLNIKRLKAQITGGENASNVDFIDQKRIEDLKDKYQYKDNEELESLLNDKRFTEEAKIAAKTVLNERSKMPDS